MVISVLKDVFVNMGARPIEAKQKCKNLGVCCGAAWAI